MRVGCPPGGPGVKVGMRVGWLGVKVGCLGMLPLPLLLLRMVLLGRGGRRSGWVRGGKQGGGGREGGGRGWSSACMRVSVAVARASPGGGVAAGHSVRVRGAAAPRHPLLKAYGT